MGRKQQSWLSPVGCRGRVTGVRHREPALATSRLGRWGDRADREPLGSCSLRRQVSAINRLAKENFFFWDYGNAFLLEAQRAGETQRRRGEGAPVSAGWEGPRPWHWALSLLTGQEWTWQVPGGKRGTACSFHCALARGLLRAGPTRSLASGPQFFHLS